MDQNYLIISSYVLPLDSIILKYAYVVPMIPQVPKKKKHGYVLFPGIIPLIIGGTVVTIQVAIHPITLRKTTYCGGTISET